MLQRSVLPRSLGFPTYRLSAGLRRASRSAVLLFLMTEAYLHTLFGLQKHQELGTTTLQFEQTEGTAP